MNLISHTNKQSTNALCRKKAGIPCDADSGELYSIPSENEGVRDFDRLHGALFVHIGFFHAPSPRKDGDGGEESETERQPPCSPQVIGAAA